MLRPWYRADPWRVGLRCQRTVTGFCTDELLTQVEVESVAPASNDGPRRKSMLLPGGVHPTNHSIATVLGSRRRCRAGRAVPCPEPRKAWSMSKLGFLLEE